MALPLADCPTGRLSESIATVCMRPVPSQLHELSTTFDPLLRTELYLNRVFRSFNCRITASRLRLYPESLPRHPFTMCLCHFRTGTEPTLLIEYLDEATADIDAAIRPCPLPDRAPPRVPHAPHRRRGHRQARRPRDGRQPAGRSPSVRLLELDNNHTNATKCNRMQHCSKFSSGHAAIVACSAPPSTAPHQQGGGRPAGGRSLVG